MPRDGSGNYTLPPNTAAVSGETVASAPYNALREDIKAALNDVNPQNTNTKAETTAEIATATESGVKNISNADSPYSVVAADQGKLIAVDASAGNVVINLLAAATAGDGFKIGFKRVNGETNTITVNGDGSETVDGVNSRMIEGDDETLMLRCDNSNWLVTATNASGLVGTGQVGSVVWCPYDTAYPGTIMLNNTRQSLSRALYPDLWNYISTNAGTGLAASEAAAEDGQFGPGDGSSTFTLPKAAGYFLRIKGGVDPDTRVLGDVQQDAMQGHEHNLENANNGGGGSGVANLNGTGVLGVTDGIVTDGANGTPRTASETRPINLAWNLCIVAFQAIDDPAQLNAASVVTEQQSQAARITALEGQNSVPSVIIAHTEPSGTNGGAVTIATWTARPLNTEELDADSEATLSANQITLEAGTYHVEWFSAHAQTGSSQTRLRNTTANATLIKGTSGNAERAGGSGSTFYSTGSGRITVAAAQVLELQYYVVNGAISPTVGLGPNVSNGEENVYARIQFTKLN